MNGQMLWRIILAALGIAVSATGYLVERRLASLETEVNTLQTQIAENTGRSEANAELLRHYLNPGK